MLSAKSASPNFANTSNRFLQTQTQIKTQNNGVTAAVALTKFTVANKINGERDD
jgi:hypothetical protein